MRDGNSSPRISTLRSAISFLVFLWGMETTRNRIAHFLFPPLVFSLPMRDGNMGKQYLLPWWENQFLVFLWGMETRFVQYGHAKRRPFLVFLWGMETWENSIYCPDEKIVFSLPMRDGNVSMTFSKTKQKLVFSLPMRDGNYTILIGDEQYKTCF